MSPFDLREPVSAWTHGLGMVAAVPITWYLIRETMRQPAGDRFIKTYQRGKVVSLAIFGLGMTACYGASLLYHGPAAEEATVAWFRRLDLVGIFLLIAGTFTPAAWSLMRPRPRRAAMVVVWGLSLLCSLIIASGRPFPTELATGVYLALGWGMLGCYREVRRRYSRETLRLLPIGGAFYTVGAALNLIVGADVEVMPGVGPHEVFHLFTLAGTTAHVVFLHNVVIPALPAEMESVSAISVTARTPQRRAAVETR